MQLENTVELLGFYGGDESHALSAWTSTSRYLDEKKLERIPDLLQFLASNEHGTPFEKSSLHFLVTIDIATHIHLLKHRIGVSINAESARYKELNEDKFYLPDDFPRDWKITLEEFSYFSNKLYHQCIKSLTDEHGFTRKRAKESARFFKAYNSQITADVMFNFRSFVHFQKLRNSSQAQREVKKVAAQMLTLVKTIPENPFQHSIKAFKL